MKLVIGHKLWSEKSLITYNSFRNAIVLLSPLTESSQGLGRFHNAGNDSSPVLARSGHVDTRRLPRTSSGLPRRAPTGLLS